GSSPTTSSWRGRRGCWIPEARRRWRRSPKRQRGAQPVPSLALRASTVGAPSKPEALARGASTVGAPSKPETPARERNLFPRWPSGLRLGRPGSFPPPPRLPPPLARLLRADPLQHPVSPVQARLLGQPRHAGQVQDVLELPPQQRRFRPLLRRLQRR